MDNIPKRSQTRTALLDLSSDKLVPKGGLWVCEKVAQIVVPYEGQIVVPRLCA